ncbi:sigma-70 family RNA polymerase sigma factor [Sphingobacterium sp. DK4209]|uniref:Sigma-70 family RNA polymerase sigma factor n=1 Tax=Sphingobacterium zhuxiongii TaxID=2662364 RepID=A0A5Q0Q8M1_9SPHI|nr:MULTISPECIES: sigma-70 family RNA polymerase sigma factor [unclassified Sphingobacterium]MVZ65319.1 sigma-70 family RNA polymerase sigma factor [Sphingobacterium sp. DK4209]QGA26407.1 sigma-70 family RNA polymerase sigma factor [Sphingobacterium sp. dk4302]
MEASQNDKLLIQEIQNGNSEAFAVVYERYADRVYALALSFLKDEGWSEDLLQEVFWKLWEHRERLDTQENLWTYLFVLTKHRALNKIREIKNARMKMDHLLLKSESLGLTEQVSIGQKELVACIERAKELMSQQQQLVFELCKTEGLTYSQAGERLNIAPNTVKNHMVQSLKVLRTYLHKCGYITFLLLFLK